MSPSPMALNLKVEEIPTHATMLEGSDSDPAACPTSTNSLDSTDPNSAEVLSRPGVSAGTSTCLILSPTRATVSA